MGNAVINHGECSKKNGITAVILNYGNSNKGKASLRRIEHPKMRGEAPNNSSTDGQVA